MAATASSRPFPCIRSIVLVVGNQNYALTVPSGAKKVTFRPTTNAARLGFESVAGTELVDGAAYAVSDLTIDMLADVYAETQRSPSDRTTYYLSSATAGTLVVAIVEG